MPILRRSVVQFCSAPLVRFHTALDISPTDSDIVLFRDSAQTSLYRSTDGLRTYVKVVTTEGLPEEPNVRFAFEDVVFAPSHPSIVYAATTGLLVFKSEDAGASFALMKNIRSEVLNVQP